MVQTIDLTLLEETAVSEMAIAFAIKIDPGQVTLSIDTVDEIEERADAEWKKKTCRKGTLRSGRPWLIFPDFHRSGQTLTVLDLGSRRAMVLT